MPVQRDFVSTSSAKASNNASLPRVVPSVRKPLPVGNAAAPPEAKEERTRTVLSELNDVVIVFYGKVQDQFGNPVVGAEVTGSVHLDNGTVAGVRDIKTVSDEKGLFQFNEGKGESLSVTPRKKGYAIASTNAAFKYSYFYPEVRYVPDPSHPTVIEMWKLQGAAHLVHFQTEAHVPLNGAKVAFDLQTGKQITSGGDIVIRIQSAKEPNTAEKYDWQASIQAVDGGLIPFSDIEFERVFQAPEWGYEPEFSVRYEKEVKPWSTTFNGVFFLKSRGGNSYGKLGIEILSDLVKNGTVTVILNSYVNPAGSRNLELDPQLVTEAKP